MQLKKILRIGGLILVAFFVLFIGLIIVVGSLSKTSNKSVNNLSGYGAIGSLQSSAPAMGRSGELSFNEMAADTASAQPSVKTGATTAAMDKKIVKTGNLTLKVEKADTAAASITNIAKQYKGEVTDSNFSQSSRGIKSGYLTVRVPSQNFDPAFAEIKKIATQVLSESTNAQDITEQYLDLAARLKNKQAEEASFVALLNRTGKIEDILSVTREVARVRGEIEQLQAQIRYFDSQTDMSTLTVNLSEDVTITPVNEDWRPLEVLKTSVKELITNGQNFIDGLISFVVVVLPILLIYVLIIWLIYFIGKKIYYHYKRPRQP